MVRSCSLAESQIRWSNLHVMNYRSIVGLLLLMASSVVAVAEDRILFKFDNPEAAKPWQTVNDGVMGGRSSGRFKINDDKNMEFFGTLSLENNGGFASVRARGEQSSGWRRRIDYRPSARRWSRIQLQSLFATQPRRILLPPVLQNQEGRMDRG